MIPVEVGDVVVPRVLEVVVPEIEILIEYCGRKRKDKLRQMKGKFVVVVEIEV